MRNALLLSVFLFFACKNNEHTNSTADADSLKTISDTLLVSETVHEADVSKTFANERFKEVTVERIAQDTFVVRGQGQIFEANFNWVVEDGHDELMDGFEMTDAGAPAWGNFEFTIRVQKERPNSTLTLILFESSAKDGSRQYELPIPLY